MQNKRNKRKVSSITFIFRRVLLSRVEQQILRTYEKLRLKIS